MTKPFIKDIIALEPFHHFWHLHIIINFSIAFPLRSNKDCYCWSLCWLRCFKWWPICFILVTKMFVVGVTFWTYRAWCWPRCFFYIGFICDKDICWLFDLNWSWCWSRCFIFGLLVTKMFVAGVTYRTYRAWCWPGCFSFTLVLFVTKIFVGCLT